MAMTTNARATSSELKPSPRLSAKDRLLAAADDLFYSEGVHVVGVDRIVERAGVTKATLYNTFGSKEELVGAYPSSTCAEGKGASRASWRQTTHQGSASSAYSPRSKACWRSRSFVGAGSSTPPPRRDRGMRAKSHPRNIADGCSQSLLISPRPPAHGTPSSLPDSCCCFTTAPRSPHEWTRIAVALRSRPAPGWLRCSMLQSRSGDRSDDLPRARPS